MSSSEINKTCVFCETQNAAYKCPRCMARYCSSKCFKHERHNKCSESFYQEWVMSTLQNQKVSSNDKEKMMEILKKAAVDRDDDDNEETDELTIEDRLADIDLTGDVEEKVLWERLTLKEQETFKKMLSDEKELASIISVKKPWWKISKVTFVQNNDENNQNDTTIMERPPLPIGIKSLSSLTSRPPSDSIQYNILNVLYSYTSVVWLYHTELRDFVEDVVDCIFFLSPVLSENKNYFTLDEAVQDSLRLIMSSRFGFDARFAKSLSHDVCDIINGPVNAQPHSYLICSLNDIKMLMFDFRNLTKKSDSWKTSKTIVMPAIKKLEYFISFCIDRYKTNLMSLSKEIELKYFPEIFGDVLIQQNEKKPKHDIQTISKEQKVLIKELN